MERKKNSLKIVTSLCISLLFCSLLAYIIYATITYVNSKSPSDFEDFPRSDVWVATGDNFSMIIDLTAASEKSGIVESMVATLIYNEKEYNLSVSSSGGHGTIFAPTASSQILIFENENASEKVHFSVSKYAFNENDFFLLDINLYNDHNLPCLAPNINLHFFKQNGSENLTFMIDYLGYEDEHQETIYLKNVVYTSSYYQADISGTLISFKNTRSGNL